MAGSLPADRLVATVANRFYGGAGKGERDALRPVVELAERAAPGVVSLERSDKGAGFDVRPAGRTFPAEYEAELRGVAAAALEASWHDASQSSPASTSSPTGFLSRIMTAVRRLFSASA